MSTGDETGGGDFDPTFVPVRDGKADRGRGPPRAPDETRGEMPDDVAPRSTHEDVAAAQRIEGPVVE